MGNNGRVKLQHIAEALNVSIGTVDRALHDRPGIKVSTKMRVLEKAEELGYQVNMVAQSLSRKRNIRLGAIVPNQSTNIKYFYDDVVSGIFNAAEALRDNKVEIIVKNADTFDYSSQIAAFKQLHKEGIDGFVICPFHRFELNNIIDYVAKKGIPVVTIGNDAPASKRLAYISAGAYSIGEMAGELMAKLLGFQGKVVVLTGFNSFPDNEDKTIGFIDKLKELAPNINVLAVYETYELRDKAFNYTVQALENFPGLSGIYVNTVNSPGVCEALVKMGMAKKIRLITSDIFQENIQYIDDGTIYASIYQNPRLLGYKAIMTLYQSIIGNENFRDKAYVRPELVMSSNLEFYIKRDA